MTPGIQFSKDDFQEFKRLFKSYADKYGITEWELAFLFLPLNDIAEIECDDEAMTASVILAKKLELCADVLNHNKADLLDITAEHEALELLLMPLWITARQGYERKFKSAKHFKKTFDAETHKIIHRLMRGNMNKTVIALGDLHCGHVAGLTPPYRFSNKQDCPNLHALQSEMWSKYKGMASKYSSPDLLIVNGDCIDGKASKNGGTELLTSDRFEQCEMAVECLKIWKAKKIILTYGTSYHTGPEDDFEVEIARQLGAEIHNHAQVKINQTVIDIKHHCGGSAVPYGRHTSPAKEHMWNLLWNDLEASHKANIILRSHVHFYNYCGGNDWIAMTLPALQAPSHNKYGGRRCSGIVDWGLVAFNINNNGGYEWQPEIVRLQSARAELIKV